MSIFEIVMLLCFGASWPVSIAKALRTRVVAGKSPAFMFLIILGYFCGVAHKMQHDPDWVTLLYVFNMCMVTIDLFLYVRYSGGSQPAAKP